MYTVDYFIKKFEAIPEKNILNRKYGTRSKGCAMGLCQNNYEEHSALYAIGLKYFKSAIDVTPIISINNGDHPYYQQATPKKRILAALYDIKAKQSPSYPDITKELAILPTEETPDQPIKVILKNVS